MKKLFLFGVAAFFFAAAGNAQVARKAPHSQKVQSDSTHHFKKGQMMDDLNLTPDQKKQLKALHEDMRQQRDAIKNDATLTPEQKKDRMKDLHKTQSEKMDAILTPDQQEKRKAFMQKRKENQKMNGKWNGKKGQQKAEAATEKS
jgi:Spy/CpxP family protein refolding chaperone